MVPRATTRGDADRAIGLKLRLARQTAGLTQAQLGKALDVSCQQVQKYENASNRLSATTLDRACELLKVPHSYFLSRSLEEATLERLGFPNFNDHMLRQAADLVQAFSRIADPEVRRSVLVLVNKLGVIDGDETLTSR